MDDFLDPVGVGGVGAGRLNAGAAVATTVTVSPVSAGSSWLTSAFSWAGSGRSRASGSASVTLAITASAPMSSGGTAASGTTIKLASASVTIAAGATATVNVALSGSVPASGQYSGTVSLAATGISITVPYLFIVPSTTIFDMVSIVGGQASAVCFESLPSGDAGPIGIRLVDSSGAPIVHSPGTMFSIALRSSATPKKNVSNEPACTSSAFGTKQS